MTPAEILIETTIKIKCYSNDQGRFDNQKEKKHVPGDVPPQGALSHNCGFVSQLQDKFEHLKKMQQEETTRLEEERRQLEEEILAFYKMKASSGTLQSQVCTSIKKDKERKK